MAENGTQKSTSTTHRSLFRWQPGIRFYLVLMNFILLCLLFPSVSALFYKEIAEFRDAQLSQTISQMRHELESRGASLARSLALSAEQSIAGYDFMFLSNLMGQVVENDPEAVYAMVMDGRRQVVAHSRFNLMGVTMHDDLSQRAAGLMVEEFVQSYEGTAELYETSLPQDSVVFLDGEVEDFGNALNVIEVVIPVYTGLKIYGVLRCGFSLEVLERKIQGTRDEWAEKMEHFLVFFLTFTAVFFLVGGLVAVLFTRFFVRSTDILSEGVRLVGEGKLNHEIPVKQMFCHEFASFADGFNDMTDSLLDSLNKLDDYSRSLEHKVEERTRELREAQADLLQQAHEAGMAEMAVGVLHNIGNAITPAKVDASMLLRRLRDSPLRTNLGKLTDELAAALQSPAELRPEVGQRLLTIVNLLPQSVKEEYDLAIKEIQNICNKHEHIEGIISLQMRYARVVGEQEEVELNLVAEDALKMMAESLSRRGVQVERAFTQVPLVRVEQSKLIQIVINLIKNAYEAMESPDLPERRVRISTFYDTDTDHVELAVRDTGIGFATEDKEKLFQFGFTTKKSGSGFGLHSCANFLIANNGTLSAHSDGPGSGAVFSIRLPVHDLEEQGGG